MKIKLLLTLFFLLLGSTAQAQSTATQVLLGYLDICSNGFVCWKPYTSANPLPVILTVTAP